MTSQLTWGQDVQGTLVWGAFVRVDKAACVMSKWRVDLRWCIGHSIRSLGDIDAARIFASEEWPYLKIWRIKGDAVWSFFPPKKIFEFFRLK